MKIRIHCVTHNANVVAAGDSLHWLPTTINTFSGEETMYELDFADLYCTYSLEKFPGTPGMNGQPDHKFQVLILADTDSVTISSRG
jgi:hypothetical protein